MTFSVCCVLCVCVCVCVCDVDHMQFFYIYHFCIHGYCTAELLVQEKVAEVRVELGLTRREISTSSTGSSSTTTATNVTQPNDSGRSSRDSDIAFPPSRVS